METQTLNIPILWPNYFEDCDLCIQRLRESLEGLHGMSSVSIDLKHGTVQVAYDKDLLTFEHIKEHARVFGVTVAERFRHERLTLVGLDCPDCASKLETSITRMRGVAWASLNYATSILLLEYEPDQTNLDAIKRHIHGMGYQVEEKERSEIIARKAHFQRNARNTLTAASGLLLAFGVLSAILHHQAAANMLYILSAVTGGVFAARAGYFSLKCFTLDTNFLMTIASLGAIWLGEYSEAAAVMFLFSLGSALEAHTVAKTRRSIRMLVEESPPFALVKRNSEFIEVPLEHVQIGETVLIKPGANIPVDGAILTGASSVNEAPITGESMPRDKEPGEPVYAGSINGFGALEVRVTSGAEDNTLARIVHMVEEAQAQKAPSQRFSETFGRIYTPCVIALAALLAAFGPIIFSGSHQDWLVRSLTLLVVSCPCALVISTPVAIVAAIGSAAKSGVLIKGGAYLETLGEVSIVAFDKTGTLTTGKPKVCGVIAFNSHSENEVLAVAAAVESRSEHPLADAIIAKAREMELPEKTVAFFEAFPGKGARAVVDNQAFYIGNRKLLDELGIEVPATTAMADMAMQGCTMVYLADETQLWGAIAATDSLKAGTAETILQLKNAGIQRTILLTGDTAQTGRAVAKQLGIDEEHAELSPQEKLAIIRQLTSSGKRVAMVGDGINDAPALAAASVGIAMGGMGTPAAIEAADVALMADNIAMLPYAIDLSRRARRIIKQNVAFALTVIALLVLGGVMKWVTLATGVLGHEGSALLVIANSMRLLKRRIEI